MSEKNRKRYVRMITPDDDADMTEMLGEILTFLNEKYSGRGAQINTVLLHVIAVAIPDEECLKIATMALQDAYYMYEKRAQNAEQKKK